MDNEHLVFLIPNRAFGGLEMQMVLRSEDSVKLGYKTLFITQENSQSAEFAKTKGICTDFLNIKIQYVDPKSILKLGKIFKSNKTKICVVGKTDFLSIAIFARNLFNPSTAIIFYQQLESAFYKKDFFHNHIYQQLDSVITLTEIMKNDFPHYTNINKDKIVVIPYGINLEKFNPQNHNKLECRRIFDLPENDFLIGLTGRITETKGQHDAITALAKAKLENTKLVICGNTLNGPVHFKLLELAKELNISDKIIFRPFTFDIHKFMNAMDISVLPSKREAFGLVVIEAMASGLPVIATNSGGVPEIIQHQNNGFLFEPFNTDKLVELIKLLHDNKELRIKIGSSALNTAKNRYDYETQRNKFFAHIQNVYEKRNVQIN